MSGEPLLAELRAYIMEHALPGEDPQMLRDDDDLRGSGILDSFSLVDLVAHLRTAYRVVTSPDDLNLRNFGTVRSIADFVAARRALLDE